MKSATYNKKNWVENTLLAGCINNNDYQNLQDKQIWNTETIKNWTYNW